MEITILGEKLFFSDEQIRHRDQSIQFVNLAKNQREEFRKLYDSAGNMDNLVNNIDDYFMNVMSEPLNLANNILEENNIYDFSVDYFMDEYCPNVIKLWESIRDSVVDAYTEIVLTKEQQEQYRAARKAHRGRWVGGGFGLKGAIKGAVGAGALNAVSGAAHSIFNAFGNIISNANANKKKEKLYRWEKTFETLFAAICDCTVGISDGLWVFLLDRKIVEYFIKAEDVEYCNRVVENAWKKYDPQNFILTNDCTAEGMKKAVIESLLKFPYNERAYQWLYYCYGDRNGEVSNMAKFFGFDLEDFFKNITDDIESKIDYDNPDSVKNAVSLLTLASEKYNKSADANIKEIEEEEKKLLEEKRTVYDIETDYVDAQTKRSKLTYSNKPIIKNTIEEADKYKENAKNIIDLYYKTDFKNLASVHNLLDMIEAIEKEYSVGSAVVNEVRTRYKILKYEIEQANSVKTNPAKTNSDSDISPELLKAIAEKKENEEIDSFLKGLDECPLDVQISKYLEMERRGIKSSSGIQKMADCEKRIVDDIQDCCKSTKRASGSVGSAIIGYLIALAIFLGIDYFIYAKFNIPKAAFIGIGIFFIFGAIAGFVEQIKEDSKNKKDKEYNTKLYGLVNWNQRRLRR